MINFGLPNIHPILVHFTIALLTVGVLCELFGYLLKKEYLLNAGWWNIVVGFVITIGTVFSGTQAGDSVEHTEEAHEIIERHETLGFIVLGIFAVVFIWRVFLRKRIPEKFFVISLVLGLIGIGALTAGGYYGGVLVYEHGVGVEPVKNLISGEHEHNHQEVELKKLPSDTETTEADQHEKSEADEKAHLHEDGQKHTNEN